MQAFAPLKLSTLGHRKNTFPMFTRESRPSPPPRTHLPPPVPPLANPTGTPVPLNLEGGDPGISSNAQPLLLSTLYVNLAATWWFGVEGTLAWARGYARRARANEDAWSIPLRTRALTPSSLIVPVTVIEVTITCESRSGGWVWLAPWGR